METKICSDCGQEKLLTGFRKFYGRSSGTFYPYCKECYKLRYTGTAKYKQAERARSNRKYKEDPEKHKQYTANVTAKRKEESALHYKHWCNMASIKSKYGLSELELQDMLKAQQGCCKICKCDFGTLKSTKSRSYVIDHDHTTGKVRGLLCQQCNTFMGHLESLPVSLKAYEDYLK